MPAWKGVISAIVTPFRDEGSCIDLDAIRGYVDFIIEKGVDGIFALGTTGEGPLLSISERKSLAEALVAHVNKRVKVIIQTGAIRAEQAIELTRHTRGTGADAAAILPPYYYELDEEAIFRHFMRIAEAVPDFPLFLYNIPQCTVNNLTASLFKRITDTIGTVVGVKTSNPDMFQVQEYIRIAGDRCSVFMGDDGLILAGLSAGVDGIVSGNSSAFPEPFVRIYRAFERGEIGEARECQLFIYRLRDALGGGGIAWFKMALDLRGIKVGGVREPHRALSAEEVTKLEDSLKKIGLTG